MIEQTCDLFEIVIVDGGSFDSTLQDAMRALEGSKLRLRIIKDPGSGIYGAINNGISEAQGDWIYVMGSDDMLLGPEVFPSCLPVLRDVALGVIVVHGDVWIEDPGSRYGQPWDLPRFLERNTSHQSAFYRHESIRKLGIICDEAYSLCADWDYNIKFLAHGDFVYVPFLSPLMPALESPLCKPISVFSPTRIAMLVALSVGVQSG